MGLAAAIGISAAVGGVASIAGAGIQASAAKSAASEQEKGLQASIAEQQQMFDTTNGQLSPYFTAGAGDYGVLNNFLTGGPGKQQSILDSLPGYQFTKNQGLESTQNSYAARGLGVSGAALKGAAAYSTGLADSDYSSFINPLIQGSSIGENAAAQSGYQGTQAASGIAQSAASIGQAQAAGTVGSAGAIANGLTSATGGISNALLTNALLGNGMYGGVGAGAGGVYSGVMYD